MKKTNYVTIDVTCKNPPVYQSGFNLMYFYGTFSPPLKSDRNNPFGSLICVKTLRANIDKWIKQLDGGKPTTNLTLTISKVTVTGRLYLSPSNHYSIMADLIEEFKEDEKS